MNTDHPKAQLHCVAAQFCLFLLFFCTSLCADLTPTVPQYSPASIVNAATQTASGFAPYTIVTVYGTNLSYTTRGITPADISGGSLPEDMDGTGVYFGPVKAGLFYVSPTQINFLIPEEIGPGTYQVHVYRGSVAGPGATVRVDSYAPGFFTYNSGTLIATHVDGSLITSASPANQGETVVIYGVGLGETVPPQSGDRIPHNPAILNKSSGSLQVSFDGAVADSTNISYAGITPGCAGLYQINVSIPAGTGPSPSVQIRIGNITGPPATLASVRQPGP